MADGRHVEKCRFCSYLGNRLSDFRQIFTMTQNSTTAVAGMSQPSNLFKREEYRHFDNRYIATCSEV